MPIQHLRLGLHFQAAQLLLQARHRARQLREIEIDRVDLLIQARAEYADLAGIVQHGIEQIRIHSRHFRSFHRRRLSPRQYRRAARLEVRQAILACDNRPPRRTGARAGWARWLRDARARAAAADAAAAGARRGRGAAAGAASTAPAPGCRASARSCADQFARCARQHAVAHGIAHARQLIETGLHDGMGTIVAG